MFNLHKYIIGFCSLLLAAIIFSLTTYSQHINSAISIAAMPSSDVPEYTKISSMDDYLKVINLGMQNLQTSLTLDITGLSTDPQVYADKATTLYPLTKVSVKLKKSQSRATLYVDYEISQAYRVLYSLKSDLAKSRLTEMDNILLETATEINKKIIKPNMKDYQKEKAIHDYIVSNTSYDQVNLDNNTLPKAAFTAAGVLTNKTGVCQGYAEAIMLLLNLENVECTMVYGETTEGASHAWNAVKLDGAWYMLDAVYDDPVVYTKDKTRKEILLHEFFNVTSAQLSKTHKWDKNKFPVANSTKYNYFVKEQKVVRTYKEFKAYIKKQIKAGHKDIECYVYNYNPNTYSLSFIYGLTNKSSISTILPEKGRKEGYMRISIS